MKKKYLFIIILAIILLLVFGAYYFYMKYLSGGIEESKWLCDAKNSCPGEMTCVKLPEKDSPSCLTDEEFNNYLCPDGNKPQIFESLPLQFVCG